MHNLMGYLLGYGNVWFHPGGIVKILLLYKVSGGILGVLQ